MPQIVQPPDWSATEMKSPSDTSRRNESGAMSRHQPGRAKLRRRTLSKRILGVAVRWPSWR